MPKIDYLVGPYYYYSLAVLILAALGMWRIVHSPFGLCLKTIRDNPVKAETLGIGVTRYRFFAFVISAIYPPSVARSWVRRPETSTRPSPTGRTPATSCS